MFGAFAASDRYDNMVVYQTPRFAGLQATVQYSFKTDTNENATDDFSGAEGTSDAQRYASIGLSGEYGPAQFAVGYELTKYGSNGTERKLSRMMAIWSSSAVTTTLKWFSFC